MLVFRFVLFVNCPMVNVVELYLLGWLGKYLICCCLTSLLITWTWKQSMRSLTPSMTLTAAWFSYRTILDWLIRYIHF